MQALKASSTAHCGSGASRKPRRSSSCSTPRPAWPPAPCCCVPRAQSNGDARGVSWAAPWPRHGGHTRRGGGARSSGGAAAPATQPQQPQQQQPQPQPPEGLRLEQMPRHVAIIMDGNSRWAQAHGWATRDGHEAGVTALRRSVEAAARWGVRALTVFAFSEENHGRPAAEVAFLFALFGRALEEQLPELHARGVRLRFIGGLQRLPPALRATIARAEALTEANPGLLLTVAVSYGARTDIAAAARALAEAVAAGRLRPEEITPAALEARLSTADALAAAGPVDLCIRTSGTQRLSNFLLFEMAYAELYFDPDLWPAFGEANFERALRAYAASERRFGGRMMSGGGGSGAAAR
ncbi:UDP pyrophosphate synthase [Raphidocelis subcapitata]|uniref:Alkyl transferase n=1 Tax=Raphidocelis subcapitata TaxID=307507 RepID=A0A2V0P5Q8_9CHLO|nr:UDP pyrophosphate synthase [Raphidocelis subcapitata]|eukprot:GBF93203.1 UDP pyrophosphate synthase [Raphidocelis subcapitata]